ncbi:DUF885 domain-containing protein [Erythrobacteraceae bacterium CFH 75059]|uniref:DUF885 domain-containing protein n=1 Tax=Qipengyuania thermophila TaxID=2509361 RepID=UPI001020DB02|nr:DUF885 domain-containing protein [Qipengyuania thermophila]TCD06623.1 DUF885 domain-containing protein [Erythrobacteraceae bacterium CFH 75059]
MPARSLLLCTAAAMLAACATVPAPQAAAPRPVAAAPVEAPQRAINALFEDYDRAQLALSPVSRAYRGIRDDDYGRWDEYTRAADERRDALLQDTAARMRAQFDPATLPEADALSWRLFDAMARRSASLVPFREYGYIFDQMNGQQSQLPAFLINIHSVGDAAQARAYVSRIAGLGTALDQLAAESRRRADAGVMPPRWVYAHVLSDIRNLLDAGDGNAVLTDFSGKVDRLDLPAAEKSRLKAAAVAAWNAQARPAYERLRAEMERQQALAGTDDGVWRFPRGGEYYSALLASYTTTDLTADQIHQLGLDEVARIHAAMRAIMQQVGYRGTLQQFFEYTRTDPRFYHTSREAYLADVDRVMAAMTARLPDYFATLPTHPLEVRPVEAFRERSAGKAFYSRPAPDGSRPGIYYVNLYNLRDMSRNELEALAYHEGVPGHHLQLSIQTALGEVPPFRRFGGVTVYSEGWGLYSEELGKDMGFYTDPYSDFGRLGMELWRAARLVVDTGIHHKRWSREQAIRYLADNTPNPPGDIEKAIERYIVYPGQATAYTIGKLEIMALRERARRELGPRFNIKGFHDAVLLSGPVPLDILRENVDRWIAAQRAR